MKTLGVGFNGLVRVIIGVLIIATLGGCSYIGGATMSNNVLTQNLSEPLNGATTAIVDINTGSGNLSIDGLITGEPLLASGILQYLDSQGVPSQSVNSSNGQATLTVKGGAARQPWFRFPWQACNAATEWQIHLNPTISSDITARSGGGNVKLNLTGMVITRLSADSGGGNLELILPDNATNLSVAVKTGGGNVAVEIGNGTAGKSSITASSGAGDVVVRVPNGIAARIHADTGLGKISMDSRFSKLDRDTYQSPDYDSATSKVELTLHSGAGNVSVSTN